MHVLPRYRSQIHLLLVWLLCFMQVAATVPPAAQAAAQTQAADPPNGSITATMRDTLQADQDGDGIADAGDTLRYTVEIDNTSASDANGVAVALDLDANTSLVPGSLRVTPLAITNTYTTLQDTPLTVASPGVLANDSGTPSPGVVAASGATLQGGTFVIASDGSFTYTPPAGFSGNDSFGYTATNSVGSDSGTVAVVVEAAPRVVSIFPANGTTNVSVLAPITVVFSEPVNVTANAFTLVCGATNQTISVTPSPASTFTISAIGSLPLNTSCTLTVVAAEVSDVDTIDPPNTLEADQSATFTTDAAPSVVSTSPVDLAKDVSTSSNITLTFSEAVNASTSSFALVCGAVAQPFALSASPASSYTLNPTSDLPAGTTCSVTVTASSISDVDAGDPPDSMLGNYTFGFTTDAAPTVVSTTPANGAGNVGLNDTITVEFSEVVNASTSSFTLVCGAASQSFSLSASPANSFTLTPTNPFVINTTCTVTVIAAQVSDTDSADPPDTMTANYSFSFTSIDDNIPSVVSSTPANAAVGADADADLTVTFNESVNASTNSFTLSCDGPAIAYTLSASPATSFTLDPTGDLPFNTACTLTVVAAEISDVDTIDPPDTMAANVVISFTTDAAPTVSSTTPADAATNVATDANLTITFSEAVDLTGNWFQIVCPTSGTRNVADTAVSGGPTSFTINPNSDFAAGESCTVTVNAAQVADQDSADPPNLMAANYVFSFSSDAAPSVSSTTPADAATNVATNANITITFSEAVNVSGNWFQVVCATSGTRTVADTVVSGGPTSFTINPTNDFAAGESCTVTVNAAQVSDQDAGDPPDTMAADYVFSFSADSAPGITATTPADAATGVTIDANIEITFSEAVDLTGNWFQVVCPTSGTRNVADTVVSGGPTSFTINPNADFAAGETCTVTVVATQVADQDAGDPPDTMAADYSFSFSTDAAPSVSSTTPADATTGVTTSANLTITFSEAVNVSGNWFQVVCPTSGTRNVADTVVTGGPTSYTINPTADFATGESCAVTVFAAQVADQDANDPPNLMVADYSFSFSMDAAPSVSSTTPANGATSILNNANLTITFSEAVDLTGNWFQVVCATSGTRNVADTVVTGGPTSYTINPNSDFASGETCTVTITAAQVADQDTNDPPDTMVADYVFSFETESAPTVSSTTPANAATNAATNANLTITFSEAVDLTGNWFQVVCPTSGTRNVADTVVTGGPTSYTINPTADFATGESCAVTVFAAQVADQDANDPPNLMAADYLFSFTTDVAPTVVSTTPVDGAIEMATNTNIIITFSEPVNVTGDWFELNCSNSGLITVGDTVVTGGPTTFTINPNTNLLNGDPCTVTVFAAQVSDQDSGDPPDTMAADYVFSFAADIPPDVDATTPGDGATTIATTTNISVVFSEPVNVSGNWFQILCSTSGVRAVADTAVTGGPTNFSINPNTDFTAGESCAVTVFAAQVADQDAGDPPDTMTANYVFNFVIDAAPSVSSTTPANTATGVLTNADLTINFSEAVDVTGNWFQVVCTTSGTRNVADTAVSGGPTSFTINPNTDFSAGESCTVTVNSAQVADQDAGDPPNLMVSNYTFGFTIEAAPSVISTTPANGATDRTADTNISITFSEPVDVTGNWFQIVCATSGTRNVADTAVSGGPTSFTINPTNDFAAGESCTVTVNATQVADQDSADPPDTMLANYVFSFTIDAAPGVISTTPANNAVSVAGTDNIVINFSESVNASTSSFTLSCNSVNQTYALSASPATSFTLNPDATLPAGTICTVTVTAAQVSDSDSADPPDTMLANYTFSFAVAPNAVDDAQSGIGNTLLEVGVAASGTPAAIRTGSVRDNDISAAAFTVTPGTSATAQGGSVTINANGNYTYTPPVGYTGADTFTYTITDANGSSDTATVTITLTDRVWYVRNTASAGGDGRATAPFNTLAAAASASAAGDYLYLYRGDGTNTGQNAGITLLNNQRLIGQGVALVVGSDTLVAAGTAPVIGNSAGSAITLAQNNTVRGLDIGNTTAVAITGSGFGTLTADTVSINTTNAALSLTNGTANLTLSSTTSSGGTNNINLNTVAGTIALGNGALSGATGNAFNVDGGTATISYAGTINNTAAARVVSVINKTAGTVSFSGAITGNTSSTGILLNNNSGATMTFSGGITLSTGANAAFTATGGGTVNVTGLSNTLTTTTGTALNVANTTIGASGLTFRSISSNGATNGIILNTTGSSGSLTVTGDGGASANGSGGTIQGSTGVGVLLTSTNAASLGYMNIQNGQNDGINGTSVNGFNLNRSVVSGNGNATGEHGLDFTNTTGSVSIINSTVTGSFTNNILFTQNSGTLNSLTIAGSTISNTNATSGDQGILINLPPASTGSITTLNVSNNTINNNRGAGIHVNAEGTSSVGAFLFNSNMLNSNDIGVNISSNVSGDINFAVENNTIITARLGVNLANNSAADSFLQGRVNANSMTLINQIGLWAVSDDNGRITIEVNGNTISGFNDSAISIESRNGNGNVQATVSGNTGTTAAAAALAGLFMRSGGGTGGETNTMCANVTGNNMDGGIGATGDYYFDRFNSPATTFQVQGLTPPTGATTTDVENYLISTDTAAPATAYVETGIYSAATCATPALPLLAAAPAEQAPVNADLSQAELDAATASAIAQWVASGITSEQVERLQATIVRVADLEGERLGQALGTLVEIDRDAAGWGWQHQDLVTVVAHELGHVLGYEDQPAGTDLMAATLPSNTRRTPQSSGPQQAATDLTVAIGTLPATKRVIITFDVLIDDPFPTSTNQVSAQATISGSNIASFLSNDPDTSTPFDPTITLIGRYVVALPLVVRAAGLPDLVVESITTTGGTLQIVIRNQGEAPVTDTFWVDLYINPTTAPTAVNQIWQTQGGTGAVWGITGSALPIPAGATRTLTIGDVYYQANRSSPTIAITPGTALYVQVDSANTNSTYGGVFETHESEGEAYNNIIGPVAASSTVTAGTGTQSLPAGGTLPNRSR
ncbi:MAG: hypothetical protein Fur005_04030 [Roseiflexaceae bacterium]